MSKPGEQVFIEPATCRNVFICKRCGNCPDHCHHESARDADFREDWSAPCSFKLGVKPPPTEAQEREWPEKLTIIRYDDGGFSATRHAPQEGIDCAKIYVRADLAVSPVVAGELRVELDEAYRRIAELERRLRIPFGRLPCAKCGGPHSFDTSVPTNLWNDVIRAQGLPEYLCTTCVVQEFVKAGKDFTARLYGDGFSGEQIGVIMGDRSDER